ncbi:MULTISPECIES: hypothetical protein [unclassified Synechocystis]|uniref:hypothetical protein n=1 Tax=unclassified Synechocystis TaxID=2640012 RepID=UPI00042218B4|nr:MULTISPECIES: hypothetical protein [unclassified Synechocystis]AIE73964.1 hypothetical protein D082_14360 [Synechocystis sp. PCC 6714]MCT0252527.1 hypothetical protein [Synechocystis sp. CS-94]
MDLFRTVNLTDTHPAHRRHFDGLGAANQWIDSYKQLNNQNLNLVKMAIAFEHKHLLLTRGETGEFTGTFKVKKNCETVSLCNIAVGK